MGETYKRLESEAEAAGTTLYMVCKEAGIQDGNIRRWRDREPKTLKILSALEKTLKKIKDKKSGKSGSK